ncbi:MAG: hypothetical protein NW224_08465 [Leptolyngbyaceae cyanobacterium bins.302]|nr:hypothetical protein [Leptolyngbyaceae cyanobacterium bins.302]
MSEKEWYWTLVRLDPAGGSRVDEMPAVKAFFQQRLDPTLEQDTIIQKQLIDLARNGVETSDHTLAELCLRCFISHQIEQVCIQLETQFGEYYGFTRYDLFAFVLDDEGKNEKQKAEGRGQKDYQPLAMQILEKFDPDRASLTTWTTRFVKQHHELNAFLLEQGLCMLSDWAILNDTKPKKLQRVLTQFHHLTEQEVQQAIVLLESYHAVYRRDRILQGQKGACEPPTMAQLQEISNLLQQHIPRSLPPDAVLTRLTVLATRLRQYRISVGGGKPPSQSLDQPDTPLLDKLSRESNQSRDDEPQTEFLQTYRQQFLGCLEHALQQVVSDRLQALKSTKQEHFLTALQLFHCQKLAMGAIAQQIGLKAQFQVSRLLKLDELRTDVRHWMLQCLRSSIKSTVLNYVEPDKLDQIDHQIAVALEEQVNDLIQKDQASSKTPKSYVSDNLFAQKLCQYLDTLSVA